MAKRGFLDGYKTYDPSTEGFGGPGEWRQAFNVRMGLDAAKARTSNRKQTPREILGVALTATWEEIKKAYRKLAVELYPEKRMNADGVFVDVGDHEKFLDVQAAFEILENEQQQKKG